MELQGTQLSITLGDDRISLLRRETTTYHHPLSHIKKKDKLRIKKIIAKNYRSLEDVSIEFNQFYNALSGKNNCGKSNIIRAVLSFLSYDLRRYTPYSGGLINYSNDYPFWKKKEKEPIEIEILLELHKENDEGLFRFISELIFKEEQTEELLTELKIKATQTVDKNTTEIQLSFGDHEIVDEYKRDELLNRIRASESVLFHNSTEVEPLYFRRRRRDTLGSFLTKDDLNVITKKKEALEKSVKASLKKHQTDFSSMLGRLTEKYDVSLGVSSLNIDRESIEISLKEKGVEVSLDDWGSGTQNRTLILLNLMNAKRIQKSTNPNKKLTPIVIIEEPESFLHPSAQAEFGRIIQDIAEEFKIQIIVATHSPYLLSHKTPTANILLDRNMKGAEKGSKVIDTSGEKWYEPFALSLGISGDDFGPLKSTIFSDKNEIILVEGESDIEYLKLLMHEKHGANKLNFKGEIFAYGGAGNLKNNILLRFVKERFKKFVVTVDLDKLSDVKKSFETLNLKDKKEFLVIGKNETGKKCVEGYVPQVLLSKIYSENVEIVQQAMENSSDGKSARNVLKGKVLSAFKEEDEKENMTIYTEFYKISKSLNKIFE